MRDPLDAQAVSARAQAAAEINRFIGDRYRAGQASQCHCQTSARMIGSTETGSREGLHGERQQGCAGGRGPAWPVDGGGRKRAAGGGFGAGLGEARRQWRGVEALDAARGDRRDKERQGPRRGARWRPRLQGHPLRPGHQRSGALPSGPAGIGLEGRAHGAKLRPLLPAGGARRLEERRERLHLRLGRRLSGRGLPEAQRLVGGSDGQAPAGDVLDPRRRLRDRL